MVITLKHLSFLLFILRSNLCVKLENILSSYFDIYATKKLYLIAEEFLNLMRMSLIGLGNLYIYRVMILKEDLVKILLF